MQFVSGLARVSPRPWAQMAIKSPRLAVVGRQHRPAHRLMHTNNLESWWTSNSGKSLKRNLRNFRSSALAGAVLGCSGYLLYGYNFDETLVTGRTRLLSVDKPGLRNPDKMLPEPKFRKHITVQKNEIPSFNFEMSDYSLKQMDVKEKSMQVYRVMQRLKTANPETIPDDWEVSFSVDTPPSGLVAIFDIPRLKGVLEIDWSELLWISSDDELAFVLCRDAASKYLAHEREIKGVMVLGDLLKDVIFFISLGWFSPFGMVLFAILRTHPFSRILNYYQEKEADTVGSLFAEKAGFNVNGDMIEKSERDKFFRSFAMVLDDFFL